MLTIKPEPIENVDFSKFGRVYYLNNSSSKLSFTDTSTMAKAYKLGMTHSGAGSFLCEKMERHVSTEEILIAGDSSFVLALADTDPDGAPCAKDISAFLVSPGTVVIIKKGIWHDACRGADGKDTIYFFLALNNGEPSELVWHQVEPEVVRIEIDCKAVKYNNRILRKNADYENGPFAFHALAADGMIATESWECWQTDNGYPDYPGIIGFGVTGKDREIIRMSPEKCEVIVSADSRLMISADIGNSSVAIGPGECVCIRENTKYKVTSDTNAAFYIITKG